MPNRMLPALGFETLHFDDIAPLLRIEHESTPEFPGLEERIHAACAIEDPDERDRVRIAILTEALYTTTNPDDFSLVARVIGALELDLRHREID